MTTTTTTETMTNARSALAWFQAQGGQDVSGHFAALTTNVSAAAEALGISRATVYRKLGQARPGPKG